MSTGLAAITMPKWGLTMTDGKVVAWLRAPGEVFAAGDELLEIETSKITNVVEAEADATLLRVVAPAGATLPVGALLAVVGPADAPAAEIDRFVAGFVVVTPAADAAAGEEAPVARMVEAGGRRLRVLERGSGEGAPVVFLHGFGADLDSWMFVQPALAEAHRTLALDLPGHGGSAKQVGAGDPTVLADAVAAALDALGTGRAHLVGHSLGGGVAAVLAARRPDLAASLTLVAPAGLGPEINAGFIDGFVRATRRKEVAEILGLLVHDPSLVSRTMVEDVLRGKRIDGAGEALETVARAWFADGRQAHDLCATIAGLAVPVQVIWGAADRIVPASQAGALPGHVPVHRLEAVGHLPHMERSGEVARLLRRFIEGA